LAESATRWKCAKDEMMAAMFVVKMNRVGRDLDPLKDGPELPGPPKALPATFVGRSVLDGIFD